MLFNLFFQFTYNPNYCFLMGTDDDVRFICYFDGELIDEDTHAKYNGGKKKLINLPKSIGFAGFKLKIQEITKLPTQFQIKCGVPIDESTLIAVDVDDDESLHSVMEGFKFIRTYILPPTIFTATQREDPILLLSATQSQSKIPIDGTSNNPVKMNMIGVKTLGNDGMNKKKAAPPTEVKLTEWFLEKIVFSITGSEYPLGDGNCGFRALCMTLGKNQNEWAWMRGKLLEQIESNNNFYNMLFGIEETCKLVQGIGHVESPAPLAKWLDMPSTGFVFAQEFNVVLVHYSKRSLNCWTFIPFLSPPNADDVNVKVLGIGFVENNQHYIKLDLGDGCPLPPIPFLWKTSHPEIAASWKRLLAPRFDAFKENVPELQVDKYPGEMMILDGVSQSNIDDHDMEAKLSRAEELLNRSDSNQEGISSYLNKRMNSLLGNHEHSEGSEVNMPEKWYVKSNVDDHQIILSGSSHSSTLDEMLYKANQVSTQVSRRSQSSVPSQLSNPNHEDNEADKGNRQESVVVKEIQFTFQRKETIISSHSSTTMPTHDREDTVLQAAAFIGETHNNHLGNGHGDLNCIDISGADMNSLEYMQNRFSQPNADHHGGIELSIRAHEHHEENEVNVPEIAVYEENQVISPMAQNVPPSDADIGSSDNCFALGREFSDIDALRNALSDMAVMTGREYKHVRTSPSKLKMKCKAEDCNWSLQATRLSNSHAFKVVKYQEVHTCMLRTKSGDKDHPQATVRWILSKVESSMERDPNMEPSKIVKEMKDRYGILISYNKAVKAKTKALEIMGIRLKEMNSVPDLDICCALKVELERDSTTICKVGVNSDGSFQHFFWSFKACIDALRNHLRPVVSVGSVNTKIGVLMLASGVDGSSFRNFSSGSFIEVGFALCVREEESSWETFLGWLKEFVLPSTTEAAGNYNNIPFSIVTNKEFEETAGLTRAVEKVLPHLHHFFFPDHFALCFSWKFKDPNLFTLLHKACDTYSTELCEENLQAIKSSNKEAYEWLLSSVGSKSNWAIAFSPNKHVFAAAWRTGTTSSRMGATSWRTGMGCWHLAFDSIIQKSSIVEIVESSRDMVADYFSKRRIKGEEAATTATGLAPGVIEAIQHVKDIQDAKQCEVKPIDGHKYQVNRVVVHQCVVSKVHCFPQFPRVVDLEEKSCTCGEFQDKEYPCEHALAVITHLDLDVRNYVSHHQWYSLDTYRATYAGILPPPIPDGISQKKRKVGRPRKRKGKCHRTL